jgi:hypothetical protein
VRTFLLFSGKGPGYVFLSSDEARGLPTSIPYYNQIHDYLPVFTLSNLRVFLPIEKRKRRTGSEASLPLFIIYQMFREFSPS